MQVRITVRHNTVSDALRRRAEERVRRLEKYNPRVQTAAVTFDEEGDQHRIEVRLDVAGAKAVVGQATDHVAKTALDEAIQRAGRQLKRQRERRVSHQAPKPVDVPVDDLPAEMPGEA